MTEYYALTSNPLPKALHSPDSDYSIRTLLDWERLAIEDYLFRSAEVKLALDSSTTAVVVRRDLTANATVEDFAIFVEFALGVLAVSGFQSVALVATFNASSCIDAQQRSYTEVVVPATFPTKVVKAAARTWIRHVFAARQKCKDRLHITADRFVRYLRMNSSRDGLVDLCICLESLIESQTEISFRFAVCLAKIDPGSHTKDTSELLSDLYDFRSKVVHGTDYSRQHRKVEPNAAKLRSASRAILTVYVFYLIDHTKDEWKKHLHTSLLT